VKKLFVVPVVMLICALAVAQQGAPADKLISDALRPLPESLRSGAAVVRDLAPGKREVLRKGTNQIVCRADAPTPGFLVRCYHKDLEALLTRVEQVLAGGASERELLQTLDAEIKAGKVKVFVGATEYLLAGPDVDRALSIMTVYVPGATSASTGLSAEPDNYRPWLMYAGSSIAHIMISGK
jgi:hypothetical protein